MADLTFVQRRQVLFQHQRLTTIPNPINPFIDVENDSSKLRYTCVKLDRAWLLSGCPMFARVSLWISQHCSSLSRFPTAGADER